MIRPRRAPRIMVLQIRTLCVAETRDGWVGVLDSDLMGLLTLAQELSSRLQTHAICVMVNDSDSWHYELFHKGREVDGFDSPGASPLLDLNELPDDMLEMPNADELAEAMEAVMETMPAPCRFAAIASAARDAGDPQEDRWRDGESRRGREFLTVEPGVG